MQPNSQPDPEFIDLVQRVLDGEASDHDVAHLNERLPKDPAALQYLVEMRMLHGALEDQWDANAGGLSAIDNRIVDFPESARATRTTSAQSHTATKLPWQKILVGVAAVLVISLGIFALNRTPPAFELVARVGSEGSGTPTEGSWIKNGERLTLTDKESIVELRSADGNSLIFQGPGEMTVQSRNRLRLDAGRLWADLDGEPIQIHVPYGVVTDIGTKFGIDQSSPLGTRLDVFEGKVQFTDETDSVSPVYAVAGESLVITDTDRTPKRGDADMALYRVGLRPSQATFAGTGIHVSGSGSAENVAVGDSILYPNMGRDHAGVSFDGMLTINAKSKLAVLDASIAPAAINLRGDPDVWIDATLSFIQAGSSSASNPLGIPITLKGVTQLVVKDIDSLSDTSDLSEVFGLVDAPSSVTHGAGLQTGGFIHNSGQPMTGVSYTRMRPDLSGSPNDWTAEVNESATDPDFFVTYEYPAKTLPSIRFVWGATTTGPNQAPFSIVERGRGFSFHLEFSKVAISE